MRRGRQGLSTAVVLLVLLLMSVIGLGVAALGMQNLNHASANRESTRAVYAAEAGVAAALLELKQDRGWSAGLAWTQMPDGQTSFSVAVINNVRGSGGLTAPDGTVVPPSCVWLVSTGLSRPGGLRRGVGVLVKNVTSPFEQAVFGSDEVELSGGAKLDSFDSSAGPYGDTASSTGAGVVTGGTLSVSGASTEIGGGVTVGAGADPDSAIDAPDSAYQGAQTLDEPIAMPSVTIPGGASLGSRSLKTSTGLSPGHYDDVEASAGAEITLSSGDYVFRTLRLRGNATLLVEASAGPVRVFIRGDGNDARLDLDLSGGSLVQPDADPTRLLFLLGPEATSAVVTGGSECYCGIYAPDASVTLTGGGDVYGAVTAREIEVTGGVELHYDLALQGVQMGDLYLDLRGWQRL